MPPTPKLNIKQRLAAQFLASGFTREQTAKRVGVDMTTVSKWRRIATFEEAINALLSQQEQEATQSLKAIRLKAVERLSELISSKNHSVALRAIEAVLKQPQPPTDKPSARNNAWEEMQTELERISKDANYVA